MIMDLNLILNLIVLFDTFSGPLHVKTLLAQEWASLPETSTRLGRHDVTRAAHRDRIADTNTRIFKIRAGIVIMYAWI